MMGVYFHLEQHQVDIWSNLGRPVFRLRCLRADPWPASQSRHDRWYIRFTLVRLAACPKPYFNILTDTLPLLRPSNTVRYNNDIYRIFINLNRRFSRKKCHYPDLINIVKLYRNSFTHLLFRSTYSFNPMLLAYLLAADLT